MVSFRDSEAVEDYPEEPLVLATTYENDSHKLYGRKWKDNRGEDKKPKEVDHFFLLIMSIIIFFMQCGFAFMEAGAVRYQISQPQHILRKSPRIFFNKNARHLKNSQNA